MFYSGNSLAKELLRLLARPCSASGWRHELAERRMGLGHRLNKAIERLRKRHWQRLEKLGWHVTPNHFYQPIPDTTQLGDEVFRRELPLHGIELNVNRQKELFAAITGKFAAEFNAFPQQATANEAEFYDNNPFFNGVDAMMYYGILREFHPRRIIEVGSGHSTRLAAAALLRNKAEGHAAAQMTAIEPWPSAAMMQGFDGLDELIRDDVQRVPLTRFDELQENDILFLDSSHVMKIGSDVQYEFFEIIPRLKPGVLLHLHDIFLPREYPREWVVDDQRFWNEQYILQAFLMYNQAFEILWMSHWHHLHNRDMLAEKIDSYRRNGYMPASIWLRRVK